MSPTSVLGPSLWLFVATGLGNLCNFLYHLYMVRRLPSDQYAMLTALIGLMTVLAVPATTVQTTTAHRMAQLSTHAAWHDLRTNLLRRLAVGGLVVVASFGLIAASHRQLMAFLRFPAVPAVSLGWGGAVALAFLVPIVWGALQGLQAFGHFGVSLIASGALKLGCGIFLVEVGWGIIGASLGLFAASVVTVGLAIGQLRVVLRARHPRPGEAGPPWWTRAATWINDGLNECWMVLTKPQEISRYTLAVALSVMAYTSLTNMDVVLVKHFFDPMTAGQYAVGAMVSRMVLFLPMAFSMVLFPKVAHATALGHEARSLLRKVGLATVILGGVASLVCLQFPAGILRVLSGAVRPEAIPIVRLLTVAMACLAFSNLALVYLLASQQLLATTPFLLGALAHVAGMMIWHETTIQMAGVTVGIAAALGFYSLLIIGRGGVRWTR